MDSSQYHNFSFAFSLLTKIPLFFGGPLSKFRHYPKQSLYTWKAISLKESFRLGALENMNAWMILELCLVLSEQVPSHHNGSEHFRSCVTGNESTQVKVNKYLWSTQYWKLSLILSNLILWQLYELSEVLHSHIRNEETESKASKHSNSFQGHIDLKEHLCSSIFTLSLMFLFPSNYQSLKLQK